jgi:hypothetical protein
VSAFSSIEVLLLKKLASRSAFGANHFTIETIERIGWKAHQRGDVKDAIHNLIRLGLLQWYNRNKGAIQINIDRLEEINELLREIHD